MKYQIIFLAIAVLSIFYSCVNKRIIPPVVPSTNTDLIISTNPDTLTDLAFYTSTYEIKVLSFQDWEIVEKPNWVIFDTLSFKGMEKEVVIKITILENSSEEKRESVIKLKNVAEKVDTIKISQQGQDHSLAIKLSVNAEKIPSVIDFTGGSYDILVISSKNWSIKNHLPWISFQETEYKGSSSERRIQLKVLLNQSTEREGEIIFKSEDKEIPITIRQSEYNIKNSPHDIYFDTSLVTARASEQPSREIRIISLYAGPFDLSTDDDWVQINYQKIGYVSNRYPATISFKDNLSPFNRTTNLYLKKQEIIDGKDVLVTYAVYQIEQQGATSFLEINTVNRNLEARSKGAVYQLEVASSEDFKILGNPAWIRMEKGTTHNKKTPIKIIVDKNLSSQRTSNFSLILNSGALKLDCSVSQKAAFVQAYPFNLEYGIILKAQIKDGIPSNFSIVNYENSLWANMVLFSLPSDNEAIAKTTTKYGFVIDAPNPSKILCTPPIFSNHQLIDGHNPYATIYVPNYNAQYSTFNMEVGIFYNGATYYRRMSINNIPIPAGLTSEDILIYTIDISELESNSSFKYKVSYEVQ